MSAVDGFFAELERHGQRTALVEGDARWSYAALSAEVEAWVGRLGDLGALRIAYQLPNGADWIALDLALLKSGRVAVPIADFFSPAQTHHVLAASGADVYVIAREAGTAGEGPPDGWQSAIVGRAWHLYTRRPAGSQTLQRGTAKLTFTSGTTGSPKGVCLSAAAMLATADAVRVPLGGDDVRRHLCVLPLSLLLENVAGVYASLGNGNAIHVPPLDGIGIRGSSGLDVARFVAAQSEHRPHSLILVPQLLLALVAAAEFHLPLPDSYRFIAVGGGRVAESLLERAARAGLPVFEGYGLTECGSVVTLNVPGASRPGSVGRPLSGAEVTVQDGELHVHGRTMLGYLGDRSTPIGIATRDLGSIDESGYVYVRGRRRHAFITAFGRNVSPEWVESELCTEIAIAHAVVFGEDLPGNAALIAPRGNADDETLAAAVGAANARLPDYARVAVWRRVDPVALRDGGCLTDNGRLRRERVEACFRPSLEAMFRELTEELP